MTIKEFAHKHSLTFFWSTIVLATILLITIITTFCNGYDRYYPGYMMRGGRFDDNYYNNKRGYMMNRQRVQTEPQTEPTQEQELPIEESVQ